MATPIFPPLSRYGQTTMDEDHFLYSETPWLCGKYFTVGHLWLTYVGAERYLPGGGGVPERALGSYEWHQRVAIPTSELAASMR